MHWCHVELRSTSLLMIFCCILFSFRSTPLLVSIPSFPDLQPKLREHDREVSRCHSGKAVSSTCWVLSHRHRILSYQPSENHHQFFRSSVQIWSWSSWLRTFGLPLLHLAPVFPPLFYPPWLGGSNHRSVAHNIEQLCFPLLTLSDDSLARSPCSSQ